MKGHSNNHEPLLMFRTEETWREVVIEVTDKLLELIRTPSCSFCVDKAECSKVARKCSVASPRLGTLLAFTPLLFPIDVADIPTTEVLVQILPSQGITRMTVSCRNRH